MHEASRVSCDVQASETVPRGSLRISNGPAAPMACTALTSRILRYHLRDRLAIPRVWVTRMPSLARMHAQPGVHGLFKHFIARRKFWQTNGSANHRERATDPTFGFDRDRPPIALYLRNNSRTPRTGTQRCGSNESGAGRSLPRPGRPRPQAQMGAKHHGNDRAGAVQYFHESVTPVP